MVADLPVDISPGQETLLQQYQHWLAAEALPAGALGPGETDRLHERHLIDSLLFLHGWDRDSHPESVWDLGSGAGLPGIPLAIALSDTAVTLVDRSGRRADLARRAVHILDLGNVEVVQSDVNRLEGEVSMLVSRATLKPENATELVRRHLAVEGVAVLGGSWVAPPEIPRGWERKEITLDPLDRIVWLLIMRR